MRLCRWLAVSMVLVFARPAFAEEQLKLFVGYSFLRPSVTYGQVSDCPLTCPAPPPFATNHPNFNGYEISAIYKLLPWIGATADFSGHYGTVTGRSSGHMQTFLAGPEVALPAKVSPFAHVLFGVAHQAVGAGTSTYHGDPVSILSSSENAFATAFGDLHIAPFLSFRAIQLDYLVTRFHSETQNQPRVSTGLVLRF
jgi:hypothetical protein